MRRALFGIALCLFTALVAAPVFATGTLVATPALWTVHGPKGIAYLLGSIHVLPKNVNWQTPQITAAIHSADTFVFEVPMDADSRDGAKTMLRANALLPESTALPSLFDSQMRTDFRQVIVLTHADPTYIVYMRPWLAALVLQGVADGDTGFIAAEGVDNKVYALALADRVKHFRALETYNQQFRLLMGNGNLNDEIATLRLTFRHILTEHGQNLNVLLAAWARGDTKALANFGPDSPEMTPAGKKALFEDRNRAWIPQIAAMLNEKHTYFITVGAGHLVGKIGVPNLLRAAGYTVDGP
jgi:uncharacterized protein YbaP (TraB family)